MTLILSNAPDSAPKVSILTSLVTAPQGFRAVFVEDVGEGGNPKLREIPVAAFGHYAHEGRSGAQWTEAVAMIVSVAHLRPVTDFGNFVMVLPPNMKIDDIRRDVKAGLRAAAEAANLHATETETAASEAPD